MVAYRIHTVTETLPCSCGKEYSCKQNLRRHQKDCNRSVVPVAKSTTLEIASPNHIITPELILKMFQENQELKEMLVRQTNELIESTKHVLQSQTQIMEYCKQPKHTNHTNNQQFNLNIFLNVQCKDAINLSDFVRDVEIKLSETELFGQIGYVEGISRIIMNRMSDLGIHKRPIHCTDAKRETIYVKDENKWDKDVEHTKTKQMIHAVKVRNIQRLNQLIPPESFILDSPHYNKQYAIIRNTTGGMTNYECQKNQEKILHFLSKQLVLEKGQWEDILLCGDDA